MELSEFITNTLLSVSKGVKDANKEGRHFVMEKFLQGEKKNSGVEFDVAVTVSGKDGGGVDGKIQVWGIGSIGGEFKTEQLNQTVSRIAFKVGIDEDIE